MGFIGKKAKNNEMNHVMQNCMDFLDLSAHIVVAWRLMVSANIAIKKLDSADSQEEKDFLQTKVDDFRIYCAQYLPHAVAKAKTITSFEDDISKYTL
jgi:hypothetical protein